MSDKSTNKSTNFTKYKIEKYSIKKFFVEVALSLAIAFYVVQIILSLSDILFLGFPNV
jgi:hypothetical protein